jgi:riboflavin synthase
VFTGLVTHIGTIISAAPLHAATTPIGQEHSAASHDLKVVIEAELDPNAVAVGDSISCAGVCLTVTCMQTVQAQLQFEVVVSEATISCTTLHQWAAGQKVNLELSLAVGQKMGGHYVSGHVDTVGNIVDLCPVESSYLLRVAIPTIFSKYLAPKGSITINGVSLTINAVQQSTVDINLIPHTWTNTTFYTLNRGMQVNVEIDTIARYIVNYLEQTKLTPLL